jgi:hypothetical protein
MACSSETLDICTNAQRVNAQRNGVWDPPLQVARQILYMCIYETFPLLQFARQIFFVRLLCFLARLHCNENPIYEFPEKELRDIPNFHIHVSVNELHISRIGSHIFL